MIDLLESCQPNGLIRINPWFDETPCVWANVTWDSYVRSATEYSPFDIWQISSVADHCIFGSNTV